MKRFWLTSGLLVGLLTLAGTVHAGRTVYQGPLVNETGLTYNNTYSLDVNSFGLDTLAFQANYSSATIAAQTFTDGVASTASLTIVSTQSLAPAQGSNTLTVVSTSIPAGLNPKINLNGQLLFMGTHWALGATTGATAVNIKNAVNTYAVGFTASTTAATVVTIKCASSGTFCNNDTLTVNTSSLTAGGAKFTGGLNAAYLLVAGQKVSYTDLSTTTLTTSSGVAKAFSDALMASSAFNTIIKSTWALSGSNGVVTATSTGVGLATNYALFSSNPSTMSWKDPQMTGGADSAIVTASNAITKSANPFTKGLAVLLTKSAGTEPGQLKVGTTYYVVPVDANTFKLSNTSTGAVAASPVIVGITTQTATGGGSFTLTPLTITGTPSFKWQASLDGSNWSDLSVSSVTFGTPYTAASSFWDLGAFNYQYIRVNVIGPTTGGLKLYILGNGRKSTYLP